MFLGELSRYRSKKNSEISQEDKPEEPKQIVTTAHAGIWLIVPLLLQSNVLDWLKCLSIKAGTTVNALRLFLNMFVLALAQGFHRVYHVNCLSDLGLALFTGYKLLDQSNISRLTRRLTGIEKLTALWSHAVGSKARTPDNYRFGVAIDEHVIPHWGGEEVGKCKVPTRGRVMRAVKVFVAFLLGPRQHLCFKVTKGSRKLSQCIVEMAQQIRTFVGHRQRLVILADKGAYKGENFAELNKMERLDYIIPAKNTANNKKQWNQTHPEQYREYVDPRNGELFAIAITQTVIKGCPEPLRTILLKDIKGEYSAFFTSFKRKPATAVADYYRTHWRQETSYRILKNDLDFDCLPQLMKPNTNGKRIDDTHFNFGVWTKLFVANLLEQFSVAIGSGWQHRYAHTLVRQLIAQPGLVALYDDRVEVLIQYDHRVPQGIEQYVAKLNSTSHKIPWLVNRLLHIQLSRNKLKRGHTFIL